MAIEVLTVFPRKNIMDVIREREALQAEALFFYNQTNFPRLLKKYALVVNGEIIDGQNVLEGKEEVQGVYWPNRRESIVFSVFWQETKLTANGFDNRDSAVGLEVYPNGAIFIYGGSFFDSNSSPGSSYLTIDEWRDNRELQESSLRKAFEIPFVSSYTRQTFTGLTDLH